MAGLEKMFKDVDEYMDVLSWVAEKPDDNFNFSPIYKDFLRNGEVGRMTEKEARECELYKYTADMTEAIDTVTRARNRLIAGAKDREEGLRIANRFLPYEALFKYKPL